MKILLSTLLIITGLNAEISKEKIQGAVIGGMIDGITGIAKGTINLATNSEEVIKNVKNYKKEREESQLKFYKKQYESRGKAINRISREKSKVISKQNEERREWIKKFNLLKKENKKLKATIKKYNMYYKNKKADEALKKEEAIKKMRMNWKSN